jgi:hypothetical protein
MRGIVSEERRFGDESGDAVPMTTGSSRRTLRRRIRIGPRSPLLLAVVIRMRLRIVRPLPRTSEHFDLTHLRFGASYDFATPLSELLLILGYGIPLDDEEPALKEQLPRVAGDGELLRKGTLVPKKVKPRRSRRARRRSQD